MLHIYLCVGNEKEAIHSTRKESFSMVMELLSPKNLKESDIKERIFMAEVKKFFNCKPLKIFEFTFENDKPSDFCL